MMFKAKILLIGIILTLVITLLLSLLYVRELENGGNIRLQEQASTMFKGNKLGIVIPFRERFDELLEFVPLIHSFLKNQDVLHEIFVINQVDHYRFNRGSLINAGFKEIMSSYSMIDYIAMHDVDLFPLNPALDYHYPPTGHVNHIAAPHLHPRYHYASFVGGILLITKEDFIQIDGLSNNYWGWGLEDDEFYLRLKEAKIGIHRPGNLTTGTSNTFRHNHDRTVRKRDMTKCYNQREVTRRRDRHTGLHNVNYFVKKKHELLIDGVPTLVLDIELKCNKTLTPWCLCSEYGVKNTKNNLKKDFPEYQKYCIQSNWGCERTNFSDYNFERVPPNNRNQYNATKKPKPSKSRNSKVDNRPPSCNEQISEFIPQQWNHSNQRLYPTMSDSAVCGYPVPVNIPVDPRFHTLYPIYQPYVSVGIGREYLEPSQHNMSSRDQFTSLPPINIADNESEIKRTHSDPGLNNQDDKFELLSSESDQGSYDTYYANEVAELKKDNQRLANELELVKIELRNLKLDISSKNNDRCGCTDPGSITNIVQEIRAAHKLMEQTLESKLNSFNANKNEITNDSSQLSLINERLEKLEKSSDKSKRMDSEKRLVKLNNSSKKSSAVTAL